MEEIQRVASTLAQGGVVALPTETVFGLAVDALNEAAIRKVYQLKGRDFKKPLSIFVSSQEMLEEYVEEISHTASELIKSHWPGPLTLIFKANKKIPEALLAGGSTVGVRISSSAFITRVVQALGRPVTATSANKSGFPSAETYEEVKQYFPDGIDYVVEKSDAKGSIESTVIDVSTEPCRVLREGVIRASTQTI